MSKKRNVASDQLPVEGILLINKPEGKTSFSLVAALRRLLKVKKVGHAGTLDPFATGVMILLVGKNYTRRSNEYLQQDKEYLGRLQLGVATDTFDRDGTVTTTSDKVPALEDVEAALAQFQGTIEQLPPMFSAKKVNGKKLCDLARQGITVERKPVKVTVSTELLDYTYPHLDIRVTCSKGTYIRTLAHDIGRLLGCCAYLTKLTRTRSGQFELDQCLDGTLLDADTIDLAQRLIVNPT